MDYSIKGITTSTDLRIHLIYSSDTLKTAIRIHNPKQENIDLFLKAITMTQLLASMLKGNEELTIKIYNENFFLILSSPGNGFVKGYVSGDIDTDKQTTIEVIKDLKMKNMFTSSFYASGDLIKDFTDYFDASEQTKSIILLRLDKEQMSCYAVLIQPMPESTIDIDCLKQELNKLSTKNKDPLQIIKTLFKDLAILETGEIRYMCTCQKEQFFKALLTLGKEELNEVFKENKEIETVCPYCKKKYTFVKEDFSVLNKKQA